MYSQTKPHAAFADTLQARVGELVARAAAAAPGAERSRRLRWLLVAAAGFVPWRIGRGAMKLFWAMLGIAMALWWSGGAWFPFR